MIRPAAALFLALLLALSGAAVAAPGPALRVDANTATEVELETIPGIGPALAARIAQERRKAPFRSLDDLEQRVRGVGPASLRRMREGGLTIGRSQGPGGAETFVGGAADARAPARRPSRSAR